MINFQINSQDAVKLIEFWEMAKDDEQWREMAKFLKNLPQFKLLTSEQERFSVAKGKLGSTSQECELAWANLPHDNKNDMEVEVFNSALVEAHRLILADLFGIPEEDINEAVKDKEMVVAVNAVLFIETGLVDPTNKVNYMFPD